ncbi:unnamed protein product [Caretta caretta]
MGLRSLSLQQTRSGQCALKRWGVEWSGEKLLLVNCTSKWKIFGSQQKYCIQKRQSRGYNKTEEIVPGKLPFGLFSLRLQA